jgi:cbb3-type cytochrome oxidase subunit 3
VNGVVEVYYERELRARFDKETAEELPLEDDIDSLGIYASGESRMM